jgi:hypothetical protein
MVEERQKGGDAQVEFLVFTAHIVVADRSTELIWSGDFGIVRHGKGPERPCYIKPQQTSLRNVLQRSVDPRRQQRTSASLSRWLKLSANVECIIEAVAPC